MRGSTGARGILCVGVDDAKHCQISVYFDPRRPPTPQERIESMWAEVKMLKEEILLLQQPPQYDSPP